MQLPKFEARKVSAKKKLHMSRSYATSTINKGEAPIATTDVNSAIPPSPSPERNKTTLQKSRSPSGDKISITERKKIVENLRE